MSSEKAKKLIGEAYYGEGAAFGDGTFLEMLMKFFQQFLGSCPLGARRAHRLSNGNARQQERARAILEYRAYEWTGGDAEQTAKIVETGMATAQKATERDFVEFANE